MVNDFAVDLRPGLTQGHDGTKRVVTLVLNAKNRAEALNVTRQTELIRQSYNGLTSREAAVEASTNSRNGRSRACCLVTWASVHAGNGPKTWFQCNRAGVHHLRLAVIKNPSELYSLRLHHGVSAHIARAFRHGYVSSTWHLHTIPARLLLFPERWRHRGRCAPSFRPSALRF